jgi:hypothetical protein
VFAGLERERVQLYPVDTRVASDLLGAARQGSALAVDAFTVASHRSRTTAR